MASHTQPTVDRKTGATPRTAPFGMPARRRPVAWMGALALALLASPAFAQISTLKRLSLEELAQVNVVSVSSRPEPLAVAPAAIQVITHDEIRRSGATSLPEALRLAHHLNIARKSAADWAITARGFNTELANKLLVLIDGRTVYTPLFAGVFWNRQDYFLDDIERIEVISGPGGTLWGANAVNGVINIITKRAGDTQGFSGTVASGSQVPGLAAARYGGAITADTHFRIYGKFTAHDDERLPDGREASDAWRTGRGGFRIDSTRSRTDTFTLQGDLYVGREGLAGRPDGRTSGGNLLGRWTRRLSGQSDVSLQVYYDRASFTLPVPAQLLNGTTVAPAGTLIDDLDTVDVDFQHRLQPRRRHALAWGFGYRFTHDSVQNAPGLGFQPPVLNQSLSSVFVQDEITLARRLSVTVGSKLEHNGYTGFEAEPSARLQWTVRPSHLAWAAVSRAVRMPARVDRDERLSTPGLAPLFENLLVGGAGFASETVVAYEAGYRVRVGSGTSVSLSAFRNQYDDLRSTSLSPPDPIFGLPFPLFFANDLEGHTFGGEIAATQDVFDWWRFDGGYAFLSEDIRVAPGRRDFNNALNETADPRHQFSLRSALDLPGRTELDVSFRWVDALRYNAGGTPGTVPRYGELGLRLAWLPRPGLELSLTAQDLLHRQHLEYVISNPNPRTEMARRVTARAAVRW